MAALRHAALCATLLLQINHGQCLAEFELFPGFGTDKINSESISEVTTPNTTTLRLTPLPQNPGLSTSTTENPKLNTKANVSTVRKKMKKNKLTKRNMKKLLATTMSPPTTNSTVKYKPFVCPEEETPLNIGPYEVPTQKDLVILMKKTLKDRFSSYHQKALYLLNDIHEATKSTMAIEVKCPSNRKWIYRQCVKHVNKQCKVITKSLVTSLELQRHDVAAFTESSVCKLTAVDADPVQLIKIVAMEEASLDFALPGFLRLLSACEHYCHNDQATEYRNPKHQMTDQDLFIKHFLTRKSYFQLLKNPYKEKNLINNLTLVNATNNVTRKGFHGMS